MYSIDKTYENLLEIEKSKFYSFAYPVFSESDADKVLGELNKRYKDATHICYAYVLDTPRIEKASDNGEPSGTAGKPILEVIKKKKLTGVLVAVVRYFGGIKLGAGGLVRAYTNSATLVLSDAKLLEIKEVNKYRLVADISLGGKIINTINSLGGEIVSCEYDSSVKIEFLGEIVNELKLTFENIQVDMVGSIKRCQQLQK